MKRRRLYEIVVRMDGEIVKHWITTSCITAMTHAHELGEAYNVGLFSSVVDCSEINYLQPIKN